MSASDPFIGEIIMFAGTFPPRDWAFCDGQILAIKNHDVLFSILGTQFGGDGRSTFALPDLRGRVPRHSGDSPGPGLREVRTGEKGGREEHTLSVGEMPAHNHAAELHAEGVLAGSPNPRNRMLAVGATIYNDPDPKNNRVMNAESIKISDQGGSRPFSTLNPYLGINFIIALNGVYPPRS